MNRFLSKTLFVMVSIFACVSFSANAPHRAEMLKTSEYEALPAAAQKVYLTELREVVVKLEALGGATDLVAANQNIIETSTPERNVASASSDLGITVKIGNSTAECVASDQTCIFAGNLSCRKGGSCRIPSDSVCKDGVLCNDVFGMSVDGKRLCVTRAESKNYQNISMMCLKRSRDPQTKVMVLNGAAYESYAKTAEQIWSINCWDAKKKMANPNRDKAACEAISIGMYDAKRKAMEAKKKEAGMRPTDVAPGVPGVQETGVKK
jgi:hypothetical protein